LGQLQGLLTGMHISGRTSSGIGGLNHLFHLGADPDKTSGAIKVWREYADATKQTRLETADPYQVVWWAVATDFLFFAPLYAAALLLFLRRARAEVAEWEETPPESLGNRLRTSGLNSEKSLDAYRRLALVGIGLILIGFLADEVENVTNLLLVHFGWAETPDYSRAWFHSLTWVLWVAGWIKWIGGLAAAGAGLVLAWVLFAAAIDWPRVKTLGRRLILLRVHVAVVLVLALAFFGHEQIPDLVRRWTPVQLVIDVALAWALALLSWFAAHWLLTRGQWQPGWKDPTFRTIKHWLFAVVLAVAALQAILHWTFRGDYRVGWGLLVPATMLGVLALMGWVLPSGLGGALGAVDVEPPPADGPPPALPRLLASFVTISFAAGVLHASFGYAVYAHGWSWSTLWLVGGAVVGLAAWVRRRARELLIWAAGGALVGLIVLWVFDSGELKPSVLVALSLLLLGGGFRLYDALPAPADLPRPKLVRGIALVVAGIAVLYVIAVVDPWWAGETSSAIGILVFFLIVVTVVGAILIWVSPAIPVPRALRIVHIRRVPILSLLVLWFVAAGCADNGGYHNVRIQTDQAEKAAPVTLQQAFDCWLGKNGLGNAGVEQKRCSTVTAKTKSPAKGAIPFVLVATTGGGIRAAYWTDLVLDCAFEVKPGSGCASSKREDDFTRSNAIFAASGISGGSLGLASYAAYLTDKQAGTKNAGWVKQALDHDALSPSGAWWLMVEVPRVFLQFRSPTDRASVLERGWERGWPNGELEQGLFEVWHDHPEAPLLLLNGTSVEDGCRFETSVLDGNVQLIDGEAGGCHVTEPFDDVEPEDDATKPPPLDKTRIDPRSVLPATRDLVDFLCDEKVDVNLSTAALLSARFPFVNPSGRIERRCKPSSGARTAIAYVVDGGYLDTSGASPLVEMMAKLGPMIDGWNEAPENAGRCIVPLMIQIDNGFDSAAARPPKRPPELLIPLKTSFATRLARAAEGRAGAGLTFSDRTRSSPAMNRYAHFVNQAHPGPHAPLGWAESRFSQLELTGQLAQDKNERALAEVRNWFTAGALSCS